MVALNALVHSWMRYILLSLDCFLNFFIMRLLLILFILTIIDLVHGDMINILKYTILSLFFAKKSGMSGTSGLFWNFRRFLRNFRRLRRNCACPPCSTFF